MMPLLRGAVSRFRRSSRDVVVRRPSRVVRPRKRRFVSRSSSATGRMGHVGISIQKDTNAYKFKKRRRVSRLDRKVYRIAHQNFGKNTISIAAHFTGNTTALAAYQQTVDSFSVGGVGSTTTTTGDINRIATTEGLISTSDVKMYLTGAGCRIRLVNQRQNNYDMIAHVYKIRCGVNFNNSEKINDVFNASSTGVNITSHGWTPFAATDKLSQYKMSIVDMTEFLIKNGDFAEYKDYNPIKKTLLSDVTVTGGQDNLPGYTHFYVVICRDPVGFTSSSVAQIVVGNEYQRYYTYQLSNKATGDSYIVNV